MLNIGDTYIDRGSLPHLISGKVIGPETWDYNCISWALDIDDYWINPDEDSVEGFINKLQDLGYELDALGEEQVAIYVGVHGYLEHMAKRIKRDNEYVWTSKIGACELITHDTPEELEGNLYGTVVQVVSK